MQGADKFLARSGSKQATATKLGVHSTYSPRSSIHFLARCSNFYKPLKKICPSNQVSVAAINSASDEKWRTFNYFFQYREQVVIQRLLADRGGTPGQQKHMTYTNCCIQVSQEERTKLRESIPYVKLYR